MVFTPFSPVQSFSSSAKHHPWNPWLAWIWWNCVAGSALKARHLFVQTFVKGLQGLKCHQHFFDWEVRRLVRRYLHKSPSNAIWHSILAVYLASILTSYLASFVASILTFYLAFYLAFFLPYVLACYLAFYLTFYSSILSSIYSDILFWHSICYIFEDALWSRSGWEHSDPVLRLLFGSGGEHCDLALAVEVCLGTLWSCACCSGPGGNTSI